MKIRNFRGRQINSHLNLEIDFNDELTFVTGINGTGKTTAINCIISLIMPRIDYLVMQPYQYISIKIEHDNRNYILISEKTKYGAVVFTNELEVHPLELFCFEFDEGMPPNKNREFEQAFYREQMSRNSENEVLKFIKNLPTPMFLGLDRRTIYQEESLHRYTPGISAYGAKRRRNIFSPSPSQSLAEALGFAMESYRSAQRMKAALDEEFRQELVLDLIEFTPSDFPEQVALPSADDFKRIEEAKKNLKRLPELLHISEDVIMEKINPLFKFFDRMQKIISSFETKSRGGPGDSEMSAMFSWTLNQSHITKISSISNRISKYNEKVIRLFRNTDRFISALNRFFSDSGKEIKFDNFGELVFSNKNDKIDNDLRNLSSGEVQLIVILAHLHFNPEIRKANVFIIDEPELSLHVEWQEKFVDALISSSNNLQFIMATHSPSIILDKIYNCIDITPKEAR